MFFSSQYVYIVAKLYYIMAKKICLSKSDVYTNNYKQFKERLIDRKICGLGKVCDSKGKTSVVNTIDFLDE